MKYPEVGRRIRTARDVKGFTQEELAEYADISPNHMSVIERGGKSPKLETFIDIANALDVSADSLLQDVVNKSTQGTANELYSMICRLPAAKQQKIFAMIRLMLEE